MTLPATAPTAAETACLHERLIRWFADNGRDLPWRGAVSPWAVLVSEVMLQQTPVARVLPVYRAWMERWPSPADLAAESSGDAVRAWGRLGYPRRALRLHAAAAAILARHDGEVPPSREDLLALPGVGDYTAAAVSSFAFAGRHAVLDTNVRRVLARVVTGRQFPPPAVTASERRLAEHLLPEVDAHHWAAATMELGALICTASAPRCQECPVADLCRWRAAGFPAYEGTRRPTQAWDGTDRQCRGRLLAVLREASGPVDKDTLDAVWTEPLQRERCLDSLVADGLLELVGEDMFMLPV